MEYKCVSTRLFIGDLESSGDIMERKYSHGDVKGMPPGISSRNADIIWISYGDFGCIALAIAICYIPKLGLKHL